MGNVRLGDITDITYAILKRSWNHRTDRLGVAVGVNSNALVSLVFFKAVANLPSFTPDVVALPSHDPPRDSENGMLAGPETASRPSKYVCVDA
jgi:ADP-dependent phosphofructokinase/glucokinase